MASAHLTRLRVPQTSNLDIHRLLDQAFAGIDVTNEVQDLKEEMRGNLMVRVGELEAAGAAPGDAARRAIEELGDVRAVVDDLAAQSAGSATIRHRVRPRPSFVVTTVLAAVIGTAALALVVADLLAGTASTLAGSAGAQLIRGLALVVASLAAGTIVAGALSQETSTNHPVPHRRAIGYGVTAALAVGGACVCAYYVPTRGPAWPAGGAVAILLAIATFAYLLATQTNRHKSWVLSERARYVQAGDRFERDPAAAARFGLYTVSIWLVTIAVFGVLTVTVGWAWSWLAFVAGLAAMMLTLARMQFGEAREPNRG